MVESLRPAGPPDPPNGTVNLGDEGLSPGDNLDDYLTEFWDDGWHVIIPGGEYAGDGDPIGGTFSEDSWLEGDGQVVLETNGPIDDTIAEGDAYVRLQNITLGGEDDSGGNCSFSAHGDDAIMELVDIRRPDGASTDGTTGLHTLRQNAGLIRYINCESVGFTDNGVYSDAFASCETDRPDPDGCGHVEIWGGYFAENDVNELRIGGDDSKIVGATCFSDQADGIRIREAGENIVCDDIDITHDAGDPAFTVRNDKFKGPGPNSATITNTRIENHSDDAAITIIEEGDYDLTGSNLDITGSGDLDLDGGPYENVCRGGGCASPTTEKKYYHPDTFEDLGTTPPEDGAGGTSPPEQDTGVIGSVSGYQWAIDIVTFPSGDADGPSAVLYEFVVDGPVDPGDHADTGTGQTDSITDQGDGTYLVTGESIEGDNDNWVFDDEVLSFSISAHPDYSNTNHDVYLDGTLVDADNLESLTSDPAVNTLTWNTATDWDTAAAEFGSVHESTQNTGYDDASVLQSGYSTADLPFASDLVVWYPMQEGAIDTVYDFGGNGFDATAASLGSANGLLGYPVKVFSGSSDQEILTGQAGPFETNQFTWIMWVRWDSHDDFGRFFAKDSSDNNIGTRVHKTSTAGELQWEVDGVTKGEITATGLDDGNWHHVAGAYDGTASPEMTMWVDGVEVATQAGEVDWGPGDLIIGRKPEDIYHAQFECAGFWWYDTALSIGGVQQHANRAIGPTTLTTDSKVS